MKLLTTILPFAVILLFFSAAEGQAEIAKGVINDRVVAAADPSQTYALYLPSSYTSTRRFPVLYCFDPGARGPFAVARFKEAAEKYNYIVVGSNNSRNGPNQPLNDIIRVIWEDTHARFSIDEKQVYVAGFSGGARVAISMAYSFRSLVAGVIACSGGYPSRTKPNIARTFVLFGTAGRDDFNNPEMQSLSKGLEDSPAHRLVIFPGGHEWLPVALAGDAIEWFELEAIRAGRKEKDDTFIDTIFNKTLARARAAEAADERYQAYLVYAWISEDFEGLRPVSEFHRKAVELEATKEVREEFREEKQLGEEQSRRLEKIHSLIQTLGQPELDPSPRSELKDLIAGLRKTANAPQSSFDRIVAKRVIDSLLIESFEAGNYAIAQRKYAEAIMRFSLGADIQPDNPRVLYHLARAYALAGEKKQALGALQKAADGGFADSSALATDEFAGLQKERKFHEIFELVKKNEAGHQ
jgi:dienelactone hydrolase